MRISQTDPSMMIPPVDPAMAGGGVAVPTDPFSGLGGGMTGMPGMPGDIAMPPPNQAGGEMEENKEPEIIYTALKSPEDIFKDYQLEQKIDSELEAERITNEIWTEYGGARIGEGADPGKVGERPAEGFPKEQQEQEYKNTEGAKWKRLLKGTNIATIFSGTKELNEYVINYIKSNMNKKEEGAEGGGASPFPLASNRYSWYRYARTN